MHKVKTAHGSIPCRMCLLYAGRAAKSTISTTATKKPWPPPAAPILVLWKRKILGRAGGLKLCDDRGAYRPFSLHVKRRQLGTARAHAWMQKLTLLSYAKHSHYQRHLPDCDKCDQRCPLSWTYDLSHGPVPMLQHALRQELLE